MKKNRERDSSGCCHKGGWKELGKGCPWHSELQTRQEWVDEHLQDANEHLKDVKGVTQERIQVRAEQVYAQTAVWEESCESWVLQQNCRLTSPAFLLVTGGAYGWC